ncbi:YeeE/YedE family protein [Ferrovibrio terrae]|uniref:YeeE/YedE family protein n=1 Tax=Ferrovibrio terrae TaxID=2594003 RepID=UPI0031381872
MTALPLPYLVNLAGLILGVVFGAMVQRSNFCTMGAISDMVLMNDANRLRSWVLAIAVAMLGSQLLQLAGLIDLNSSIYAGTNLGWLGAAIGGLLFGFGMVQAGGCGSRTLVRLGAGNLKSLLVVLMIGIAGYATLRGLIGPARLWLEGWSVIDLKSRGFATQTLPDLLGLGFGLDVRSLRWGLGLAIPALLLLWVFRDARFRRHPVLIAAGIVIGLVIVGGWAATGILGADEFEPTPLVSMTFVAPIGYALQYLMTFTGATLDFGVSTVGGVILGAFLMAKADGSFRIESFANAQDVVSHLLGGVLMGIGGVTALGCTVGQGLTGVSTLALGSFVALGGIVIGGILGVRYLEEGNLPDAIRALFARG